MQLKLLLIIYALTGNAALAGTYSDCAQAIKDDDQSRAKELAATLLSFNTFSADDQVAGAACLTFAMGKEYVFSVVLNTFSTKEDEESAIAEARKQAEEHSDEQKRLQDKADKDRRLRREAELAAAAVKETQTAAVWKRVYDACSALYSDDPNTTVTNQICLNVFLQTGLPAK